MIIRTPSRWGGGDTSLCTNISGSDLKACSEKLALKSRTFKVYKWKLDRRMRNTMYQLFNTIIIYMEYYNYTPCIYITLSADNANGSNIGKFILFIRNVSYVPHWTLSHTLNLISCFYKIHGQHSCYNEISITKFTFIHLHRTYITYDTHNVSTWCYTYAVIKFGQTKPKNEMFNAKVYSSTYPFCHFVILPFRSVFVLFMENKKKFDQRSPTNDLQTKWLCLGTQPFVL